MINRASLEWVAEILKYPGDRDVLTETTDLAAYQMEY